MDTKTRNLIKALKEKRESEGLSIRALSAIIGISFSSLARIERGEGEPDNNSRLRILEWLGGDARESGLTFENVAFVHFRASKNAGSTTIHCLLKAANILKSEYDKQHARKARIPKKGDTTFPTSNTIALSKVEMEDMAENFRLDLGLKKTDALDALNIQIEGVSVYTPDQVTGLEKRCLTYLKRHGSDEWSAMSVPLDEYNDKWAIFRNDQHTIERQRVTFLEECWHILLGHKLTKIAKIADAYGRTFDSNEEHDAFYLASASLLPASMISKAINNKSAEDIANEYGTSPELVEYRIKRLGLWRKYTRKEIKLTTKSQLNASKR